MVSSPICTLLLLIRSTDTHYWNNATFGHLFCFLINLLFVLLLVFIRLSTLCTIPFYKESQD